MNKLFEQAIKVDYYTPRIKAEVIFDTLLTPFIEEIVGSELNKKDLILVAKEFPLLTNTNNKFSDNENNPGYIDYLLMDQSTLYLVELKTDNQSYSPLQHKRYSALKECDNGGESMYKDFKSVLSYGEQGENILENFEKENLKIPIKGRPESAPVILSKILNGELYQDDDKVIDAINKYKANNRKYLWQLHKMLSSSSKRKLREIFEKESKDSFKDLEIIYIVPKKTKADEVTLGSEIVIELNELVNKKIKFNEREKGYLNRTKAEFDAGWESFQEIWKSLNI